MENISLGYKGYDIIITFYNNIEGVWDELKITEENASKFYFQLGAALQDLNHRGS